MRKNVRKTKVYGKEKAHRLRDQRKAIKKIDKILGDIKRFYYRSAGLGEQKMWSQVYSEIEHAKHRIAVWS